MSYLITTEIKGVKYYANILKKQPYVQYQWEGLRNNATQFDDKEEAQEYSENMASRTPLQVIPKH